MYRILGPHFVELDSIMLTVGCLQYHTVAVEPASSGETRRSTHKGHYGAYVLP